MMTRYVTLEFYKVVLLVFKKYKKVTGGRW